MSIWGWTLEDNYSAKKAFLKNGFLEKGSSTREFNNKQLKGIIFLKKITNGYTSDVQKANRIQESIGFPKTILIDNCNACNMRCSMCDHINIHKYRKIQTMDIGLYRKIIDETAIENPNARVWEIFFGDPFLCKDISDRVKYAKSKGLTDIVLNSNGALILNSLKL